MNKYKIGYLDEEESWNLQAWTSLKNDFDLFIFKLPIQLSDIWAKVQEQELDAMIIDYKLYSSGVVSYDGNEVIKEIASHNSHFPMILMTSYQTDAVKNSTEVLSIRGKEILNNSKDKELEIFIQILKAKIDNYYSHKKTNIDILLKLNTKDKLTAVEEAEKFKAELYLSELDIDNSVAPNMLSSAYSSQLRDLLQQLKSLDN